MGKKINILIVDDMPSIRENISKLLEFHPEVSVAGQVASAAEAIAHIRQRQPDVVLMDINMPGMDGIAATEVITAEAPGVSIIIMSVQGEQEYLRRAMIAGAKNYLIKPFTGDELVQAVKLVHGNEQKRRQTAQGSKAALGKVITVFSTKGGVGKTTIATNLAVTLGRKLGVKVGILDADLQFGDVSLFLNIMPKATIADALADMEQTGTEVLESYCTVFDDHVKVMAAPIRPEQADAVGAGQLAAVLDGMRELFDYVVVDTAPVFNESMLSVLDNSDCILVISSLDLPAIKNVKLCLEIMESLNYPPEKIKLVLNRENSEGGIQTSEVEESLRNGFIATLPSDGKTVLGAVNRGIPFVISHPDTLVAQSIFKLARAVSSGEMELGTAPLGMVDRIKQLFR